MMRAPRLFRVANLAAAALIMLLAAGAHAAAGVSVSSISPNTGSLAGGTFVSITGSGFQSGTPVTVTIDGVPLTGVTVVSDTEITGTTGSDTTLGTPTVSSVSPNSGPTSGGTRITISGSNFGRTSDVVVTAGSNSGTLSGGYVYDAVTAVTVGGSTADPALFGVTNSTTLTVVTPPGIAGIASVLVETTGGNSGGSGNNLFAYTPGTPSVTAVGPTFGLTAGGNTITFTGSNFVPGTYTGNVSATTFTIGGNAVTSVLCTSTTSCTGTVPAGSAGAADVTVTTEGTSGIFGFPNFSDAGYLYLYIAPTTPVVGSVSPATGSTVGGTQVTISGSGFTGATSVTFGSQVITAFQINSDGSISLDTPANTAGPVNVSVTVTVPGSGTTLTGTGTNLFTYTQPAPIVTSIAPSTGSTAGGTAVTIIGQYFTNGTSTPTPAVSAVTIGGAAVTSFTVVNDGEITAVTAAHAAASGLAVQVTTPSGTGTGVAPSGVYTYGTPAPTISSVSPNSGSISGGQSVTITGQYFTGATTVTFGGTAATGFTVNSDTSITATTPAHTAGIVDVAVTTAAGGTGTGTDLYSYAASPPTVATISPTSGPPVGGTAVTITGTNFTGTPQVTIGGVAASQVTVINSKTLTAVTPAGTGSNVPVIVTTSFGSSTAADIYSYTAQTPPAAAPTVSSVSPPSGPLSGSTPVTINGTNFTGATSVTFGGNAATNVAVNANGTQITALTPAGTALGFVSVSVTTPAGTGALANAFQYVAAIPTVTLVSPNSGTTSGGNVVFITGTNFTPSATVTFGSIGATNVTFITSSNIQATVPAGTAGPVTVTVRTSAGAGTGSYTYVAQSPPTVTEISPNGGSITNGGNSAGGSLVTITGTNFINVTSVTIGGITVTPTVTSTLSMTAVTPPHAPGAVDIVVTTSAGSGTGSKLFTYVAGGPTVTAISPPSGSTAGGTGVTITGTNFYTVTDVMIGDSPATSVTVVSPTEIMATTPVGTAGLASVVVTTPAGTGTGTNLFTYLGPPTVTGISPNQGTTLGSTPVTITGTNFVTGASVTIGGSPATSVTVTNPNTITAVTPTHAAGPVNVVVTTPAGSGTGTGVFTFVAPGSPTVTAVLPSTGPPGGGTSVTITGTNFTGATAVMFGSANAKSFTVNSATSITATSPSGSGTVNLIVTTALGTSATGTGGQFSYAKVTPTLTLSSSPNPSVLGQAVTFTAKVTGASPTGIVTFTENGQVLGTATLSAGVATFTIATLAVGQDAITASYGGDANNAADPETVIQTVNGSSDSARLRQMQLAAMPVEASISSQAITGAIDNAIGSGFSGVCSGVPTPNGSGFSYCFDGSPQADNASPGAAQQAQIGSLPAPQQAASAKVDNDFAALSYTNGLPGTRWDGPQDITPQGGTSQDTRLAGDLALRPTPLKATPYAPPAEWLAWVDVRFTDYQQNSVGNDLKDLQGNTMFGLTRRFSSHFLIGVTGGYENFNFTSQAYNGVLRGQGGTAGGYVGWQFGHLRAEAAGTWSEIFASASSGAASANFTGTRVLGFGGLTGTFAWFDTVFEPSAQVYTAWEHENGYTDSLGTQQGANIFDTGRGSGGVKVSHAFPVSDGSIAPYVGFYGDYYFTMNNTSAGTGVTTPVPILQGWAGRATGGITTTFHNGAQLSAGGEYSGIGNNTQIWTVTVRGSVPF
jgi:IPT/TIG domain